MHALGPAFLVLSGFPLLRALPWRPKTRCAMIQWGLLALSLVFCAFGVQADYVACVNAAAFAGGQYIDAGNPGTEANCQVGHRLDQRAGPQLPTERTCMVR